MGSCDEHRQNLADSRLLLLVSGPLKLNDQQPTFCNDVSVADAFSRCRLRHNHEAFSFQCTAQAWRSNAHDRTLIFETYCRAISGTNDNTCATLGAICRPDKPVGQQQRLQWRRFNNAG